MEECTVNPGIAEDCKVQGDEMQSRSSIRHAEGGNMKRFGETKTKPSCCIHFFSRGSSAADASASAAAAPENQAVTVSEEWNCTTWRWERASDCFCAWVVVRWVVLESATGAFREKFSRDCIQPQINQPNTNKPKAGYSAVGMPTISRD